MHRSGFEKVCDAVAYVQTSLGEATQWAVSALLFGGAAMLLVRTMVAA